jgi:hypothetical protein
MAKYEFIRCTGVKGSIERFITLKKHTIFSKIGLCRPTIIVCYGCISCFYYCHKFNQQVHDRTLLYILCEIWEEWRSNKPHKQYY